MKIADILLLDFDAEISNTRRTLERVPDDKGDWKCHDKSMAFGRLAMHCATIPLFGHYIIEDDGMDMAAPKRPHLALEWKGRDQALAALDDAAGKCRTSLLSASDEVLMTPWRFSFGQQLIGEAPRAAMFRSLFFDHMIHHTAQLGVYLRLNDVPVPALYGPSADEQWSPR
ncbi:MAG TPA: DinB family protein [Acidobacteriaceae bacterium]|nr:DinB family protein [Acidobacteriaceae bacterium]